MTNINYNHEKP